MNKKVEIGFMGPGVEYIVALMFLLFTTLAGMGMVESRSLGAAAVPSVRSFVLPR